MKRIHLLRTTAEPGTVTGLIAAARDAGLRVGWLELTSSEAAPRPATSLDEMAEAGALRAVALEPPGRTVAVKRSTGPLVLRDLLREHFLGCALVLIRTDGAGAGAGSGVGLDVEEVPVLEPADGGWRVLRDPAPALALTTEELVARLKRPRPWS